MKTLKLFIISIALVMLALSCGTNNSGDSRIMGSEIVDGKIKVARFQGNEIIVSGQGVNAFGNYSAAYPEDQQNPHVINLPDKQLYFSVWEDWRNRTTTGADIYGQFFKYDGTVFGPATPVALPVYTASGDQTVPRAAYNSTTGTIVVVWQDGSDGDIRYLRITSIAPASGAYAAPTISTATSIVSLGAGAQEAYQAGAKAFGLYSSGRTLTGTINTNAGANPIVPTSLDVRSGISSKAKDDGAGNITGTGFSGTINYTTGAYSITITSSSGLALNDAVLGYFAQSGYSASFTLNSRQKPRIAYDSTNNRFWIVWVELRNDLHNLSAPTLGGVCNWQFGDASYIGYIRLNGTTPTTALTSAIGTTGAEIIRNDINTTVRLLASSSTQAEYEEFRSLNNPDIACESGACLITFEGIRYNDVLTRTGCGFVQTATPDANIHIYGIWDMYINQPVWQSLKFDEGSTASNFPAVYAEPVSKKFLVAWQQADDIKGQLIQNNGDLLGSNLNVCTNSSKQSTPHVSYDSVNQRFFVIWEDDRNGGAQNLDIYGQYIDANGSLRGQNYFITNAVGSQYYPTLAYSNTTNEFLAVWKDGRSSITGTGKGSDIYGQRFNLGQPQVTLSYSKNGGLNYTVMDALSLTWDNTPYGLTKDILLKIENTGDTELNISNIALSGAAQFTQVNSPTIPINNIPVGGTVVLTLRFSPPAANLYSATLTITSDGGTKVISLSGQGTCSSGILTLSPTTLDFGTVAAGSTTTKQVTLTNSGTDSVIVTPGAAFTDTEFSWVGAPASVTLTAGASYAMVVQYVAPASSGSDSGTVTLTTNACSGNQTLSAIGTRQVGGTGVGTLGLSSSALDFGTVANGSVTSKMVTLTNTGGASISITAFSNFSSYTNFSYVNKPTGTLSLSPGASFNLYVKYAPATGSGGDLDIIKVTSDASNGTQYILVQGVHQAGGVGTGSLTLSTPNIDFGTVADGSNVTRQVALSNTGAADVTVAFNNISSPFSYVNKPSGNLTLSPGMAFNLTVKYAPTASDPTGNLDTIVLSGAPNGDQYVLLQGVHQAGGTGGGILTVSTASLNFGSVSDGSITDKPITISNTGTAPINISFNNISSTSNFSYVNAPPVQPYSLAAGASFDLTVRYAPPTGTSGSDLATMTITSNATNGNQSVVVQGIYQAGGVGTGTLTMSTPNLDFGTVANGSNTTLQVALSNTGAAAITITTSALAAPFSYVNAPAGALTLYPGMSYNLMVKYSPTVGSGGDMATITISGAPNGTQYVLIQGVHQAGGTGGGILSVSTASLNFGTVTEGSTTVKTVTISNTGTSTLNFSLSALGASNFSYVNAPATVPYALDPGATFELSIQYAPPAGSGSDLVTATVTSADATNGSQAILLQGIYQAGGVGAGVLTLSTPNLDFGTVANGSNTTQQVALTNSGAAVISVTLNALAAPFSYVNAPAGALTLYPGMSYSLIVKYSPTVGSGGDMATIAISGAPNGTQYVLVQGVHQAGGTGGGILSVSTASLNFGTVTEGSTTIKPLTISNTGTSTLNFSLSALGGNFSYVNAPATVPYALDPGANFELYIQYAPPAGSGSDLVTITVTSADATNGSQSVLVQGVYQSGGIGTGILTLSTPNLDFGTVANGSNTTLQVALSNTGEASISVSLNALAAPFSYVNAPAGALTLYPNQSFNLYVKYSPTAGTGGDMTTVTITGAPNGTQYILAQGVHQDGGTGGGILTLSSASMNFGVVTSGSTTDKSITISNTGTSTLTFQLSATGGNFSYLNAAAATTYTLTAGAAFELMIRYSPPSGSDGFNILNVAVSSADATNGTQNLLVQGVYQQTVVVGSGTLSLSATSLDFGTIMNGTTSTKMITISNTGTATITISLTAIAGPTYFSYVNDPGSLNLPAGASFNLFVKYAPPASATATGNELKIMTVNSDASNGDQDVLLQAIYQPTPGSTSGGTIAATFTPPSIDFGNVTFGTASQKTITISNAGTSSGDLTVTTITLGGTGASMFSFAPVPGGAGFTVAPGGSIVITVTFTPAAAGISTAAFIVIGNNSSTASYSVFLQGSGVAGTVTPPVVTPTTTETATAGKGGCFIATAAYGSYLDPHVMVLREFRDKYLLTNAPGRAFVAFYYRTSPAIADFIRQHESLRAGVRVVLTPLVFMLEYPIAGALILGSGGYALARRRRRTA